MNWRPIETAPKDVDVLFYIRPRNADEAKIANTDGEPILGKGDPRIAITRYRRWSCLEIATHWMPLPEPPR